MKNRTGAGFTLFAAILLTIVMVVTLIFSVSGPLIDLSSFVSESESTEEGVGAVFLAFIIVVYFLPILFALNALLVLTLIPAYIAPTNGRCVIWGRIMAILDLIVLAVVMFVMLSGETINILYTAIHGSVLFATLLLTLGFFRMPRYKESGKAIRLRN